MSTAAVERARDFPTTYGFTATTGFSVHNSKAAAAAAPAALSQLNSTQLTVSVPKHPAASATVQLLERGRDAAVPVPRARLLQEPIGNLSSSLPSSKSGFTAELASALSANAPLSPAVPVGSAVGWQGLLEFSETSGCSGVLGPKTTSEDLDSVCNRDCKIEICCTAHTSPAVRRLVKSVIRGLRACQEPDKATDGMGGTYFFANESGGKAAILKPCDEEPLAPNNPKGYVGRQLGDYGWKPTVRVGEAAIREVAAYLLDHDGWARVPTSVLVRARHPVFCYQSTKTAPTTSATSSGAVSMALSEAPASPGSLLPMKLGSLQEFVTHECDTSEMGPSRFSVRDVHRIGILDLRLFNTDRHAGNMLVRTPRSASASTTDMKSRMVATNGMYELIPIDHGFCLPETLEAPYFEWLHWPQAMLPFSEDELQYIRELDVERDKAILRQELPILRPECLRVLEVCTTLLKRCAEAGLTLFDIASVMTRPFVDSDEDPSELERMCAYARELVDDNDESSHCEGASEEYDGLEQEEEEALEQQHSLSSPPYRGATISSIKEECEDMLFELSDQEGEEGRHSKGSRRRAAAAAVGADVDLLIPGEEFSGGSSPDFSRSSSLSTAEAAGSLPAAPGAVAGGSMDTSASGVAGGSSGAMAISSGASGAVVTALRALDMRPAPMASSVHVTDGFRWRKMKTQQAAKRATGGKGGALTCQKRSRMAPQVYPPPVATFSPERMSQCFSGMTEEQWGQFMDVINQQIHLALEKGCWKQQPDDLSSGMALSCPRF